MAENKRPESAQSVLTTASNVSDKDKGSVSARNNAFGNSTNSRPRPAINHGTREDTMRELKPVPSINGLSGAPVRFRPGNTGNIRREPINRPATAEPIAPSEARLARRAGPPSTSTSNVPSTVSSSASVASVASAASAASTATTPRAPARRGPPPMRRKPSPKPSPKPVRSRTIATTDVKSVESTPFRAPHLKESKKDIRQDVKKTADPPSTPYAPIENVAVIEDTPAASKPQVSGTPALTTGNLRVYEDPVEASERVEAAVSDNDTITAATPRSIPHSHQSRALEEVSPTRVQYQGTCYPEGHEATLPTTGVSPDHSEENHRRRWNKMENAVRRNSATPPTEIRAARAQLESGLRAIRQRTADMYTYRQIQGLIKNHNEVFEGHNKLDELLSLVLEALRDEYPDLEERLRLDLKTQMIVTLRDMMECRPATFKFQGPYVLTTLLHVRKWFEPMTHVVGGMEKLCEDIADQSNLEESTELILDFLDGEDTGADGVPTYSMAYYVLAGIMQRANSRKIMFSDRILYRLGTLCNYGMKSTQHYDIRRAVMSFALQLYDMCQTEHKFFTFVTPTVDNRDLITYYIAKRHKLISY